MSSDLSERYNDGIVQAPDLSADVPPLRRPGSRPVPEQVARARDQLWIAVVVLVVLALSCCLLMAGLALYVLGVSF